MKYLGCTYTTNVAQSHFLDFNQNSMWPLFEFSQNLEGAIKEASQYIVWASPNGSQNHTRQKKGAPNNRLSATDNCDTDTRHSTRLTLLRSHADR